MPRSPCFYMFLCSCSPFYSFLNLGPALAASQGALLGGLVQYTLLECHAGGKGLAACWRNGRAENLRMMLTGDLTTRC